MEFEVELLLGAEIEFLDLRMDPDRILERLARQ